MSISKVEFEETALRLSPCCQPHLIAKHYITFSKQHPNSTTDEARKYIAQLLPPAGWFSLRDILGRCTTEIEGAAEKARKWLLREKCEIIESICGTYLPPDSNAHLSEFLDTAKPIRPYFDAYCSECDLVNSIASYHQFIRMSKGISKTKYHPYIACEEFWCGPIEDLNTQFQYWSAKQTTDHNVSLPGFLNVSDAAQALGISENRLLSWYRLHPEHGTFNRGQLIFPESYVLKLAQQWASITPLNELIQEPLLLIPAGTRIAAKSELLSHIKSTAPTWLVPANHFPQQDNKDYVSDRAAAVHTISHFVRQYPALPLNCLQAICNLTLSQIREKISAGIIDAQEVEHRKYLISLNEKARITEITQQYTLLDAILSPTIEETNSQFEIKNAGCRSDFLSYCEENQWWDTEALPCSSLPLASGKFGLALDTEDARILIGHIKLWIAGYKKNYSEKITLLLNHYRGTLPKTVRQLERFLRSQSELNNAMVTMTDRLLFALPKELCDMDNGDEFEHTVIQEFLNASLVSCDILNSFLKYGGYTNRIFTFERTGVTINTNAYPMKDFSVMLAAIVNNDVITELELVQKAVSSKRYADLWLFIALHMFAAWRSTDFIRLPAPPLRYPPEVVLQKIKDGSYTDLDAKYVAQSFIAEIQIMQRRPNKTKHHSNIAPLYFECPESCLPALGTILSIATAHYELEQDSGSFVHPIKDIATIRNFFGPVFLNACQQRPFSGRRANKTLMQAIELTSREEGLLNPLVARNLASHIRSHKGSYGKLAETTDIYLKDAEFSGHTPEFIFLQMQERGVCSFAIDKLLEECYSQKYSSLSITAKTAAIKELGLEPYQADSLRLSIKKLQSDTIAVLRTLRDSGAEPDTILSNLAVGCGTGKTDNVLCLCKAAELPCFEVNRQNCMGCPYEVRTKALLLRLCDENERLKQICAQLEKTRDSGTNTQHITFLIDRNKHLRDNILRPIVLEINAALLQHTSEEEYSQYSRIVKEVVDKYAASG